MNKKKALTLSFGLSALLTLGMGHHMMHSNFVGNAPMNGMMEKHHGMNRQDMMGKHHGMNQQDMMGKFYGMNQQEMIGSCPMKEQMENQERMKQHHPND